MKSWGVVDLPQARSWAPLQVLPSLQPKAAPEAYMGPLVRLGDLVEFTPPSSGLHHGERVVTPGGVSPLSGAVQPSDRASSGVVFRLGDGLHEGDVLAPLLGKGPCVLVASAHHRLPFSRGFVALRPTDPEHALPLWALLSSSSGLEARHRLGGGSVAPRLSGASLGEILVPIPDTWKPDLQALLPTKPVDEVAAAPLLGAWRVVSLHDQSTWGPAPLLDPLVLSGVLLSDLGTSRAGRLDARQFQDQPFGGSYPALRSSDVGRLAPRWWTQADDRDVAKPGALLIGSLSLRVATTTEPVAVAKDIFVVDIEARGELPASDVCGRLVGYLSSAIGQRRLRECAMGSTIHRLTKRALLGFRVPPLENLPPRDPAEVQLLATRLESALWS